MLQEVKILLSVALLDAFDGGVKTLFLEFLFENVFKIQKPLLKVFNQFLFFIDLIL
jgi:hypothetical protein